MVGWLEEKSSWERPTEIPRSKLYSDISFIRNINSTGNPALLFQRFSVFTESFDCWNCALACILWSRIHNSIMFFWVIVLIRSLKIFPQSLFYGALVINSKVIKSTKVDCRNLIYWAKRKIFLLQSSSVYAKFENSYIECDSKRWKYFVAVQVKEGTIIFICNKNCHIV